MADIRRKSTKRVPVVAESNVDMTFTNDWLRLLRAELDGCKGASAQVEIRDLTIFSVLFSAQAYLW